jgi:hypothetical protein
MRDGSLGVHAGLSWASHTRLAVCSASSVKESVLVYVSLLSLFRSIVRRKKGRIRSQRTAPSEL